ncbi:MAG TPA: glycosyltransferase family 2 protein [Patescibacteria group bacterium]
MTKLPLTVIILTNRTDARLTKALKSVTWAEQIVVVDTTGHLTFTAEQRSLITNLIVQPTPTDSFDFSKLRNNALHHAHHDWVFFLDSDEWFPSKWLPRLQKYIETSSCYAISIWRSDIFLGQEMKHGEVGKVRLVRFGKKQYLRFARPVHEIPFTDKFVCLSPIEIKHTSHTSVADFLRKVTWYAQREAKYRFETGQKYSLLQLIFYPPAKFGLNFFLKLGFLDGWRGFIYALVMSLHSLFVRIYLYELEHTQ